MQYHGKLELKQLAPDVSCPYLIVDGTVETNLSRVVNLPDWAFKATVSRPTDKNQKLLVYKRVNTKSSRAATASAAQRP